MSSKSTCEYYIELYWPSGKRRFDDRYGLYVHDRKVDRVNDIPTGSKILFYETGLDDERKQGGSKTLFAAGTLTNMLPNHPYKFEDTWGKWWRESRQVHLELWVPPANGVSLDAIRAVLHKKRNWKMRHGPYPIEGYEYDSLCRLPGIAHQASEQVNRRNATERLSKHHSEERGRISSRASGGDRHHSQDPQRTDEPILPVLPGEIEDKG